jgi:hypothetical protein
MYVCKPKVCEEETAGLVSINTVKNVTILEVYSSHLTLSPTVVDVISIILHQYFDNFFSPWSLVRERTIPTDRPPLVDEVF